MAFEWIDNLLGNKISKEAEVLQGTDAKDHFERKVKASNWIADVSALDADKVDAEYLAAQAAEARALGKTAAHEFKTDEEVIKADYSRDVKSLSDYALAEMLAEARGNKEQNTAEMFSEHKEKAKKEVASSREKAEKALLDMIPEHTMLDWKKAFEKFSKEAKPEEPKEKDLYEPKAPEAAHDFEKPTEEKFKVPSEEKKADVMIGVGREADERTDVTAEAGVVQESITEGLGKVASQEKKADYEGWKNSETWQVALWLDNDQGLNAASAELAQTIKDPSQLAEALKNLVEEAKPDLGASLWDDMINWAMAEVDWMEVANHFSSKFSEASALPKVEKVADPVSPLMREELPTKEASARCPVCGNAGRDVGNGQKDNMSCKDCGIMYEGHPVEACAAKEAGATQAWDVFLNGKEIDTVFYNKSSNVDADEIKRSLVNHDGYDPNIVVKKASQEIQSHASKADVIKKVAEIQSPWAVVTDENGQEHIARVSNEATNLKESEEKKDEEIQK